MTQRQFAEFLRVGEASVKRWETWLVQDASSDELIRVKCIMAKRVEAFGAFATNSFGTKRKPRNRRIGSPSRKSPSRYSPASDAIARQGTNR
jgi:hypothetical protein